MVLECSFEKEFTIILLSYRTLTLLRLQTDPGEKSSHWARWPVPCSRWVLCPWALACLPEEQCLPQPGNYVTSSTCSSPAKGCGVLSGRWGVPRPFPSHGNTLHSNLQGEPGEFCFSARWEDVHWVTGELHLHTDDALISYLRCSHTGKVLPELFEPAVQMQHPWPRGCPLVRDVLSRSYENTRSLIWQTEMENSACPLTDVSTLFFHTACHTNPHLAIGNSQDGLTSRHPGPRGFLGEVCRHLFLEEGTGGSEKEICCSGVGQEQKWCPWLQVWACWCLG